MMITFDLRCGTYGLKLDKVDGAIGLRCASAINGVPSCVIMIDEGQAIDLTDAPLKALDRRAIEKP